MKKFNFLSVLLVALFMFLGFSSNAQYKSVAASITIVDNTLNQLSQTTPSMQAGASVKLNLNTPMATNALNVMKVKYGQMLREYLKSDNNVAKAFLSATAKLPYTGASKRIATRNQAEAFYKNLLKL